jgi:ribonuclease G
MVASMPTSQQNIKTDIITSVSDYETRIGILENDSLVELLVERPEKERMVGDIYKGRITAVLPGLQAAFVDIGGAKSAFLHLSDVGAFGGGTDLLFDMELDDESLAEFASKKKDHRLRIQDIFQSGQEVLVQVIKEAIGDKGPKVTSEISLPGRYLVLVPGAEHVGVSRKITGWEEKKRVKRLAKEWRPEGFGLIVRTVGEGKTEKEFEADIRMLTRLWRKIKKRVERRTAPSLVHKDMEVTSSIIRDLLSPEVDRVVIDSRREYRKIISYLGAVAPNLRSKVEYYDQLTPIFDHFGIEPQIERMLDRKVWIKKGAYIVIDQTEALVTIDVNTGRFTGRGSQEATIFMTNIEAAKEIARQIRLRDIGGIIVIDFIDMSLKENRKRLFDEFKVALRRDRSKTFIYPPSDLGIVEMTRERTRPSLMYTFSDPCPLCSGIGRVLSKETIAVKVERWFARAKAGSELRDYRLVLHPLVAEILADGGQDRVKRLSKRFGFKIDLIRDTSMHPESFKVIASQNDADITQKFLK